MDLTINLKNNRWRIYIIALSLLILLIITYISIFNYFLSSRQNTLNEYAERLESEYEIITQIYSDTADLIYTSQINTDHIKKILVDGFKADNSEAQNVFRDQLLIELSSLYNILVQYNFRQLHFHDKNNISFLRFHRPEKFGDDLTGIRYSVEYVNEEKKTISGFEEGRIFNGYRNVYPLSYNGEHIGSVEISISIKAIIDKIEKLYDRKTQFIFLKSQMDKKVFGSELDNYLLWHIDERWVLDKGITEKCLFEDMISEKDVLRIRQLLDENGTTGENFSIEMMYGEEMSVMTFMPVKNFLDENVAFLITLSDNIELEDNDKAFIIISIIYLCLLIMIIILAVYYSISRKKIEKIVQIDHLTKSDTRRVLMEKIDEEYQRFSRYKRSFSIIMLDIDHFKHVNDVYGHLKGDEILKQLTVLIKKSLRNTDSLGRYGGEEFIVVLPETSLDAAARVAENIRKLIAGHQFLDTEPVTVSMGVAEVFMDLHNIEELIEKADQKLYRAKESGRNQVCS